MVAVRSKKSKRLNNGAPPHNVNYRYGTEHQYGDHLGSAQVVTNYEGKLYERYEYTPYGEVWIEWANTTLDGRYDSIAYRFTGKELDTETGFYYYGARYLDPKTSRWLSADPALGEYIPIAPVNDEARRRNGSLPGQGGVYNYVNLHVYHYAGNNPLKYTDPDGRTPRSSITLLKGYMQANYKEMDYDVGFTKRARIIVAEGMILSMAPGTSVQLNIEGIEKKINIKNNSDKYFYMDVDATINALVSPLSEAQEKAFADWEYYGELGMEANYDLMKTALFTIWGSFLGPEQAIGEGLAGNTLDNINQLMESLDKVFEARKTIYKLITIECE